MTKDELLLLFESTPIEPMLSSVIQEARNQLASSKILHIVIGESQSAATLAKIYTRRLETGSRLDKNVAGLKELTAILSKYDGILRGGYVETDSVLIYFWFGERNRLIGCLLF